MSVKKQKSDLNNIPEGAVMIDEETALAMQWKLFTAWIPKSEVWFFRYGPGILSASSVISSSLIMQYYRRKLKLFNYGKIITFVPGVIFPALMIPPIYMKVFPTIWIVTEPILLQNHCPVCIQMRSVAIQSILSIPYPMLVNSIGSFLLANSWGTYRIPEFSIRKPGEILSFWTNISKRLFGNLPMHFLLQFVVAIFITEMTAKEVLKVQAELEFKQKSSS